MDAVTSALLGTVIGGAIGVVGIIITVIATARQDRIRNQREKANELADRVRSTYEFALNVFFNLDRGGGPDRATMGDTFARLSLYGSPEVRALLDAYVKANKRDESFDLKQLVQAMQDHLKTLDSR